MTGTIYGTVWEDLDHDGAKDTGEPPVSGATIRLRDASYVLLRVWVTQAEGTYSFLQLPPGQYYVGEEDPVGFASTTSGEVVAIVGANQSVPVHFGDYRLPTATPTNTPERTEHVYVPLIVRGH